MESKTLLFTFFKTGHCYDYHKSIYGARVTNFPTASPGPRPGPRCGGGGDGRAPYGSGLSPDATPVIISPLLSTELIILSLLSHSSSYHLYCPRQLIISPLLSPTAHHITSTVPDSSSYHLYCPTGDQITSTFSQCHRQEQIEQPWKRRLRERPSMKGIVQLKKQVQEWNFLITGRHNPSPTPSRPTPPHLRYWTLMRADPVEEVWCSMGPGGTEFRPKGPRVQLMVVNEDLQHNGTSTRL
ncbi:unnamed protein product [Gadus morhua 'NCC']